MDLNSISERVKLKTRAAKWVDMFLENCTIMTTEQVLLLSFLLVSPYDDTQAVGEFDIERGYNAEYFWYSRLNLFGLQVTERALKLLTSLVHNPGGVSMFTAAIVYVFFTVNVDGNKLITFKWLNELLERKWITPEAERELWDIQKLDSEYGNIRNLVDVKFAWTLLTEEESEYLAAEKALSEASG